MSWTNDVVNFFMAHSGASMATLTTRTLPKVNKTNGKRGADKITFAEIWGTRKIYKVATRYVGIGHRYSKTLQNRLDKEETDTTYKPEPRKWGERIGESVLFTHTDKQENTNTYLEYFYVNANCDMSSHHYEWDNGERLTEPQLYYAQSVFNLDPPKKVSPKQEGLGLTDDNNIIVNCIKVDNVQSIKAFGHELINAESVSIVNDQPGCIFPDIA